MWCTTRLCAWSSVVPNLYHEMPSCLQYTLAILFADDSTLFKQHKHLQDLFLFLNADLLCDVNGIMQMNLVMNADKAKYILFSRNTIIDPLRLYN